MLSPISPIPWHWHSALDLKGAMNYTAQNQNFDSIMATKHEAGSEEKSVEADCSTPLSPIILDF